MKPAELPGNVPATVDMTPVEAVIFRTTQLPLSMM